MSIIKTTWLNLILRILFEDTEILGGSQTCVLNVLYIKNNRLEKQ